MAQPANTFDTYVAIGNREDLQDKIYMVSPEATPVLSAGRRFKAEAKTHEWQRDVLATPNPANAVIEGDDRAGTVLLATARVANLMQLMDKVATVSSSQEKTTAAGRPSEMKYQVAKAFKELKRDLEARIVSNSPAVVGSNVLARQAAGLGCLLFTNVSHGATGSTTAHTAGSAIVAPVAGTARPFTEALVKTVMQSIYTQSGEMPTFMSMTPSHKGIFSTFTGIALNRYDIPRGKQAVVVGGADLYMSDFGTLSIVPNYIQATSASADVFILNPETYGVAYLQDFQSTPLAKTGHTSRELVLVEATLVVTAERANGKIAALTP